MTNLTTIDCTRNAAGQPCFIVFDTWNMTNYALVEQRTNGWCIRYPDADGGWSMLDGRERFPSPEAALKEVHNAFEMECSTP